jgi:hypothetical protein
LVLLYSPLAFAWGGLAHEAICELAFLELNDTARQRVIELIQQDSGFRTFRASCNWPDLSPRKRAPEHFINVPRNMTAIGEDACPLAEKCAVTAIADDFAVLASSDATDEEKVEALKFLGHWVGDVHPASTRVVRRRPGRQQCRHTGQLLQQPSRRLGPLPR